MPIKELTCFQRLSNVVSRLCETHEQKLSRALKEERLRSQGLALQLQTKELAGAETGFSNGTPSHFESPSGSFMSQGRPPPEMRCDSEAPKPLIQAGILDELANHGEVQWCLRPSVGTWLTILEPPVPSMKSDLLDARACCWSEGADCSELSVHQQLQKSQELLQEASVLQASLENRVSLLVEDIKRKEEKIHTLQEQQEEDICRVIRAKDCELEDLEVKYKEDAQLMVQAKEIEVVELKRFLEESIARETFLTEELQRQKLQNSEELQKLVQQAAKNHDIPQDDKEVKETTNVCQELRGELQKFRDGEVALKEVVQGFKDREAALKGELQAVIVREVSLKRCSQQQQELLDKRDKEIKKLQETEKSLRNVIHTRGMEGQALLGKEEQHGKVCNGNSPGNTTVAPETPRAEEFAGVLERQERALSEKELQVAALVNRQEKELRVAYAEVQALRRELQVAVLQKNSLVEESKAKDSEFQAAQKRHALEMKIKDCKIRSLADSLQKQDHLPDSPLQPQSMSDATSA